MKQASFLAQWILILLLFCVERSICQPRDTPAAIICSNLTAAESDRQEHVVNYVAAMDSLAQMVYSRRFGTVTNGTGNNTIYAFFECMKDLSQDDCNLCFAQIKIQITTCRPIQSLTKGARLFYDGCYFRYDDYMFFNESLSSEDRTVCGDIDFVGNRSLFAGNVMDLVKNMSVEGPKNDGFFMGFLSKGNLTVYGLGQCWEFVNGSYCVDCLENSVSRIGSCPPKVEGRVLNAGCYIRYSTTRFYNDAVINATKGSGGGSHRRAAILASTCAAAALLIFVAIISFLVRRKILRRTRGVERKKLGELLAIVNKSRINFAYETLERATNYFDNSNKLGQGGSGTVYKGTLPGGQIVAVKRLMFNTTQWADHFFNEVNLISGIDHKNLVKLLGCSITGPESLLVYEYVANQSLHDYLFVRKDVQPLGWEERYKIILGTAEGLAYLHEESNLRIIHRDIKLSNVLLDEDLTPRIADFGLARLFPEDKAYISTVIAGTLGYMAPEYIVSGKLTEKADVYSFGVLVIEVVCGTKVYAFSQNSYSILQKVWNLYGMGKLSEAVDSSIKGKFPQEEANRLLQIGLTCVQADAELRPSMPTAVKMISRKHEVSVPTQPPFINSGSLEIIPHNNIGTSSSHPDFPTHSSGNEITELFRKPR